MSDNDPSKEPGQEDRRNVHRPDADINLEDEAEVEEWCKAFACTPNELRAAVTLMGRSSKRVRAWIRDRQQAVE